MKRKNIYMNEKLEKFAAENEGNFSGRLGEVVDRYSIIMEMEQIPEFTETEVQILSEVICGSVINRSKIYGLHFDILDCATGTPEERTALYEKVKPLSPAQRIKIIETLKQ